MEIISLEIIILVTIIILLVGLCFVLIRILQLKEKLIDNLIKQKKVLNAIIKGLTEKNDSFIIIKKNNE